MLGLALGLDVAPDLHPLDAREQLHLAAVQFVEELAFERPTVLLVEDIHWAEPDLLDLLERIVSTCARRSPCSRQRDPTSSSNVRHGARRSGTRPCSGSAHSPADAATRMLDEMLSAALPEDVRRLVVERADGNPFFLEELVGELVDSGALVEADGEWVLGVPEATLPMPDTVHAVLAARIDRLPPTEKAALQAGAGRRACVLEELPSSISSTARSRTSGSSRSGTSSPSDAVRRSDDREFAIKHALTREVAYGSIPKARRGQASCVTSPTGSRRAARQRTSARRCSPTTTPRRRIRRTPTSSGPETPTSSRAFARVPCTGCRAPAASPVDARDGGGRRALHASGRAVGRRARAGACSGARSARRRRFATTARGCGGAFLRAPRARSTTPSERTTYAYLAFQSSIRSAMWSIRLNMDLIEEWASKALELAADETSEARARALIALANIELLGASEDVLVEAARLADELDSVELRSFVLGARVQAAFDQRRFEEAAALS